MRINPLARRLQRLEALDKATHGPDVICLTGRDRVAEGYQVGERVILRRAGETDAELEQRAADAARVASGIAVIGAIYEA
ncbi:hypothetical protein [Cobetia sp. 1CM21F]|uniref:hypothetical protein n=1 Tax=Cobetia sp. 1CM21F TaxID=2929163 RepID=UPI0020BF4B7A|nr:hypothetical protein [Cobetia sp. 1CM21F]MCK8069803.1 hypothetical protein [Cobetia sp. 1CM21F]